MYYFDGKLPDELREAIERCGEPILLSDTDVEKHRVRPVDIKRWCRKNLKTFVWMDEQDVTDVSLQHDYIYAFYISAEKDRNWFALKWQS